MFNLTHEQPSLDKEHIVCAECFHSAPVISCTSTQRVCPDPVCPDPFRHSESHQWVDESAGVEEGVPASQELVIVTEQHASGPVQERGRRGRRRKRNASTEVPSAETASNQVSSTGVASNQVLAPPTSSQSSTSSGQGSRTVQEAPDQPPLSHPSSPVAQPASHSIQPALPPSDPLFPPSQATHVLFFSQPWILTNQGSSASQVSAARAESHTSTSTTESDLEWSVKLAAAIERSVRIEDQEEVGGGEDQGAQEGGVGEEAQDGTVEDVNEVLGENEEDGDREAEVPRAILEPTTQTGCVQFALVCLELDEGSSRTEKRRLSENGPRWRIEVTEAAPSTAIELASGK
ncbi:unnamed protein product [Rhizoctonia solani]|uniref:Uncharacterized protein n=1 Tax=Rhizoctonia solani TaxID=456999 RepID=A0A8H3AKH0_9AGAM|nr:unnamed protein product [Rhizoctonia solani]